MVALIIQIVNMIVQTVAGFIMLGIDIENDPGERFSWARDTGWPAALDGLGRTMSEQSELDAWYAEAQANIANPSNWWNQAAGHAKDPLWMAGQKRIVDNYIDWSQEIRRSRAPGIDNQDALVADANIDKKGSVYAYRMLARGLQVTVLMFSLLQQKLPSMDLSFNQMSFLGRATLIKLYPGDEEAAAGRLPKVVRGDMLADYLGLVYAGYIDPLTPVPFWLLGFSVEDWLRVQQERLSWPSAQYLVQLHRMQQDSLSQGLQQRYSQAPPGDRVSR